MITNCKNCGAPLIDQKCEYCGTDYNQKRSNNNNSSFDDLINEIEIIDEKIKYLEVHNTATDTTGESCWMPFDLDAVWGDSSRIIEPSTLCAYNSDTKEKNKKSLLKRLFRRV